ncbi:acyl-CoA dehydrogenase family protein [Sphingopyxis sp. PET50]|uniref:acyl-CoA dehydrogenase family protein n=1 Tax=Sphingopyxis sp. PET50 TaxID=2976533 RepID=UPI0021AE4BE8|nr:acyl-CoA dehydrogenase family protein [Sphingopyxis sp. PET50]
MSILYDEGQQAIATESRRVLEARVNKDELLALLETTGQYHDAFWTTAKEQGWTALALPEAYGGLDLGLVELGLIAHQAGRSLSGAPFLTSGFGAAKAIELYGTDAQKAKWLPGLASGETIGAVAFASGPDALPARPAVTLTGDRLDGTATGVSGGLAADIAVVFANGPGIAGARRRRTRGRGAQGDRQFRQQPPFRRHRLFADAVRNARRGRRRAGCRAPYPRPAGGDHRA